MSKRVNKNYPPEYRDQAVSLVISSKKSTAQVAKELGINPSTLYAWVNQAASADSSTKGPTTEELFSELRRVKKELAEVKEQRDILKKATAYFAKESK